ncbi:TPA: tryptophan--tRNA ligase [Candidatus Falkowbacteria bacterium]|nr:tryptophan--tRNA ligase [Candidatus Falkowbacteria bacterium]
MGQVVVSGIRATGKMHIGNYLGAMRYFATLSHNSEMECFFFIANLHTLTTRQDPEAIKHDLREIVLDFLAAGVNPDSAIIYAQSSIPETSELSWLLTCLCTVNELQGLPHFKEKKETIQSHGEIVNAGLLIYPALMAADILGVRAELVPVGQDQRPHVELTRDLARRFNSLYSQVFPIPQTLEGEGIRVPSLTGEGKMGKSDTTGLIFLDDSAASVTAKLKVAKTDPARERRSDPGNPDHCNIFTMHHIVSTPQEIAWASTGCQSAGIGCVECKMVVAKHLNDMLGPIQERRQEYAAKGPTYIDEILHAGGLTARVRVKETVDLVKDLMGVPSY